MTLAAVGFVLLSAALPVIGAPPAARETSRVAEQAPSHRRVASLHVYEISDAEGVDADLRDLLAFVHGSAAGGDTIPPEITLTSPNGGESWEGGSLKSVGWNVFDDGGIQRVDIFYRDAEGSPWVQVGSTFAPEFPFAWYVHNTPTAEARVLAVAEDFSGNVGVDSSDAVFVISAQPGGTVGTTLRDFRLPGTQAFGVESMQSQNQCANCHGDYDPLVEPSHLFKGSLMNQAVRDPLFLASLVIAEQDAKSSGDFCLRCHAPVGWLLGNCNPTDGLLLTPLDKEGVSCGFCHRMVDPLYEPGVSPPEDEEILDALDEVPGSYGNAMYVVDPDMRRRGPYSDPEAPHSFLESPFHRSSALCGTCHDVLNPVFIKVGERDFVPGPLDQEPAGFDHNSIMPLETTFSEWTFSDFPGGVFAPDFAGAKEDGIVSSCQDCHMSDAVGQGCNFEEAPVRGDLGLHDFMGGNTWIPSIMTLVAPGVADSAALADAADRAVGMLQKAAVFDLLVTPEADSFRAEVTVTNRTGHKLPTGYPEGRRMWTHIIALDQSGDTVFEAGAYDFDTGVLAPDTFTAVYEAEYGFSPTFAASIGAEAGPNFHFAISDTLYKDTRIPPMGFTNADYAMFSGAPVDPDHEGPGPRYADGQNWDTSVYPLPADIFQVRATLYYQVTTKEYVEFLRDENETNNTGQRLYDLWLTNGKAAPVAMAADTFYTSPAGLPEPVLARHALHFAGPNPFSRNLDLRLDLPRPQPVVLSVYDVQGRRVRRTDYGVLGAGPRLIRWDGRDDGGREAGSGIYWARVAAGGHAFTKRVVRIQ